jgi:hypothetical protein
LGPLKSIGDYKTSKAWTLTQTNATATVYGQFSSTEDGTVPNDDSKSACISDSIIHDNIAPTTPTGVTILNKNYAVGIPTPTVVVAGVESGATVYVATDNSCTTSVGSALASSTTVNVTTSTLTTSTLGTYQTLYSKQVDRAGNTSSCSSVFLTYRVSPNGMWTNLTSSPSGRDSFTTCRDTNGDLYLYSGADGSGILGGLYKFTVSTYSWSTLSENAASQPGALNGTGCGFDNNNNLWLFGGTAAWPTTFD